MARQALSVCAALYCFAFLLPLVAARLGGRSCHTSFFFPQLRGNDLPSISVDDGDEDGASAGVKIFSIAGVKKGDNGWIQHHRLPSNFVQVRLLNLHRQSLFHPGLSHPVDLPRTWRDTPIMENPFLEHPTHHELLHTWTFSTGNPHRPITWVDVHSRRGMWRHDFADSIDHKPLHRVSDEWRLNAHELWRIVFGLLLGAACGMVFAATLALAWALLRRLCMRSRDDDDVGFLYGYQELPSPRSSEKEDVKSNQKEFTKENAAMVENM